MSHKIYDIGIIGAGVSGCLSSLRLLQKSNASIAVFDIGRPFAKRRRQLEGALGCFPSGDGKLYLDNFDQIQHRNINHVKKYLLKILHEAGPIEESKNYTVSAATKKKIINNNYEIHYHNYIQWKPENIHKLSKQLVEQYEANQHRIDFLFDNEVFSIYKKNNQFTISSEKGEFYCKKIILNPGRSGWRWATKFYNDFGILTDNSDSWLGVKFEMPASCMKDFNKAHASLSKEGTLIGPISWGGTIVPEDHADLVLSSFRSNEERWKSEKVSFSVYKKQSIKDHGTEHSERLAKLTYLLFNDRVSKEKNKIFLKNKSQLNLLSEFNWLFQQMEELNLIINDFNNKASYYIPDILCKPGKVNLSKDFETNVEGLFVTGEAAGINGIIGAMASGVIAADKIIK